MSREPQQRSAGVSPNSSKELRLSFLRGKERATDSAGPRYRARNPDVIAQESTPARHASVKRVVTGTATTGWAGCGRHPPCVRSGVMPVFELTLLGTFGLTALGTPRSLRSHKAQALLTYLALRPLQAHRRDTLASLLWSHVPTSQARHSLRQTISFIRSALDDVPTPLIVTEADTLRLNTPEVSVDAIRFVELASSGPGSRPACRHSRLHRGVARRRAPGRARVRPMACGRTRTTAPPRRGGVLARAAALNRRRPGRRGDCHRAPSALARSPARMGAPRVDEALSPAGPVRGRAHTGTTTAPASSSRNSASSPNSRHASCWTSSEEAGGRLRPPASQASLSESAGDNGDTAILPVRSTTQNCRCAPGYGDRVAGNTQ